MKSAGINNQSDKKVERTLKGKDFTDYSMKKKYRNFWLRVIQGAETTVLYTAQL